MMSVQEELKTCGLAVPNSGPLGSLRMKSLIFACFLLVALVFSPVATWGQKEFDPEDPEVQAMIQSGVSYITSRSHGALDYRALCALAVYKAELLATGDSFKAKSHPYVKKVVEELVPEMSEDKVGNGIFFNTMYSGAISCILLLEIGPDEYQTEIQALLGHIYDRQQNAGGWGYRQKPTQGDISQMQYIAFAIWLADLKNTNGQFNIDRDAGKKALEWLISAQQPNGNWTYMHPHKTKKDKETRPSLTTAGLGSVYLYAELLGLKTRSKRLATQTDPDLDLPPSVYEISEEELDEGRRSTVPFNRDLLNNCITRGNRRIEKRFTFDQKKYKMYYMYAFERYASIREYLEGEVDGMEDWYDQGVRNLMESQTLEGAFPGDTHIDLSATTAFGILFLTRSMQLSLGERHSSVAEGIPALPPGVDLYESRDGRIRVGSLNKSVASFTKLIEENNVDELKEFLSGLGELELDSDGVSRTQQLATMRRLVTHEIYEARLAAVKFLSKERSLENVPALLFALTDPDLRIAEQANIGLQFISRITQGYDFSDNPTDFEKEELQKRWTDWYLRLLPDAGLLHDHKVNERNLSRK